MSLTALLAPVVSAFSAPDLLSSSHNGTLPSFCKSWEDCDCRNRTWDQVKVLSWHIHYTTNSTDMKRFYWAFVKEFGHLMKSDEHQCPFGPNYGLPWPHVCSLESAESLQLTRNGLALEGFGGSPWSNLPQRAFFIPVEHIGTPRPHKFTPIFHAPHLPARLPSPNLPPLRRQAVGVVQGESRRQRRLQARQHRLHARRPRQARRVGDVQGGQ